MVIIPQELALVCIWKYHVCRMAEYGADYPYKTIGWHLKFAREQRKESLAEVSGAVEIDERTLVRIENGMQRPSEDVLLLLISHLNLEDAEATSLWELAGYEDEDEPQQQAVTSFHSDMRVIYTDMVHVMVNDYGVVLNFMQGNGASSQLNGVARVGMSKDHARRVLEMLQAALNQPKPKAKAKYLPAPKTKKRADSN